jgi:hypothetical protein
MSKKDMLGAVVRALVGVPQEHLGVLLDVANKLGGRDGELWKTCLATMLREGAKSEVEVSKATDPSVFFRQLFLGETIALDPTDGTITISQANEIFTSYLSPDFVNWNLDVPGPATEATEVSVHELVKDGTFRDIFESLNCPLDRLCLTQHQIVSFVVKHRTRLREEGYGNFFLFKRDCEVPAVPDNLFVADVDVVSVGRLRVNVRRFLRGNVWCAEYRHRFVFPQLTP